MQTCELCVQFLQSECLFRERTEQFNDWVRESNMPCETSQFLMKRMAFNKSSSSQNFAAL